MRDFCEYENPDFFQTKFCSSILISFKKLKKFFINCTDFHISSTFTSCFWRAYLGRNGKSHFMSAHFDYVIYVDIHNFSYVDLINWIFFAAIVNVDLNDVVKMCRHKINFCVDLFNFDLNNSTQKSTLEKVFLISKLRPTERYNVRVIKTSHNELFKNLVHFFDLINQILITLSNFL